MTNNTNTTAIPDYVTEALAEVRESGEINMMDYHGVMKIVFDMANLEDRVEYHKAVTWLNENKPRYMEALNKMAECRT